MANTTINPFVPHNSTVKAWCSVSPHHADPPTQERIDLRSFCDGYNLYLDIESQTYAASTAGTGALKFTFVNPMQDDKYKVFVQVYADPSFSPAVAHVLNSPQYPKTTDSFWIRLGSSYRGSQDNIGLYSTRLLTSGKIKLKVVVL
jgi:hypothetical protein